MKADKRSKKADPNINVFLMIGIALILLATILNLVVKSIAPSILTIIYIMGVFALIIYMWEIQYRRRTGDYHDEGSSAGKKKAKRK